MRGRALRTAALSAQPAPDVARYQPTDSRRWSARPSSWRPRARDWRAPCGPWPEPPAEGTEAAAHARGEFAQWQAQQITDAIQQQIAALRPLLETLPTATRQRLKLSRPSRTTGAKSTRNACRCTASLSPSSSRKPKEKASGPVAGAIYLRRPPAALAIGGVPRRAG